MFVTSSTANCTPLIKKPKLKANNTKVAKTFAQLHTQCKEIKELIERRSVSRGKPTSVFGKEKVVELMKTDFKDTLFRPHLT